VKVSINYKGYETKSQEEEVLKRAMKKFKKQCEIEGILKDVRRKAYYEKPSDIRRRKRRISKSNSRNNSKSNSKSNSNI